MSRARWIGLLAGAGLVAAAIAGLAAGGADDPEPRENAPVAKVESVSRWTVALMPPLVLGGQDIHTVRVKGTLGGRGTVELDPNPVVVDRFGNTIKTGLRAYKPVEVEVVLLPDSAPTWRLFDLRPAPPAPAWPDKIALQLAVSSGPCGPNRLVVLDNSGAVTRIVTMEDGR